MRSLFLDWLGQSFAIAGGTCFVGVVVTLHFMRVKVNARVAPEHRISWFVAPTVWKLVIDDYRRLYPRSWG
jgi:hypothetical protein